MYATASNGLMAVGWGLAGCFKCKLTERSGTY
jgi:hypothetical protein